MGYWGVCRFIFTAFIYDTVFNIFLHQSDFFLLHWFFSVFPWGFDSYGGYHGGGKMIYAPCWFA